MQQNNDLPELTQGQSQSSTSNGAAQVGTPQTDLPPLDQVGTPQTDLPPPQTDLPPLALAMEQLLDRKLAALEERLFSRLSHQVALSEQRLAALILRQTGNSGAKPGAAGEGGMELD